MGRSKTSASASGREGTREASRGDPESVPGDAESGVPTKEDDMAVSKNRVFPPKWMVKIMVPNPISKWMIWGENPPF